MKETLPRSNTKSKRNIDSPSFTCENSVKLFVMFCLTVLYFLLIGVAFLLGLLISSNNKEIDLKNNQSECLQGNLLNFGNASSTSILTLKYNLQAPIDIPKDILKYEISVELNKQLESFFKSSFKADFFQEYSIDSINCTNVPSFFNKSCRIDSVIKFKSALKFLDSISSNIDKDRYFGLKNLSDFLKTNELRHSLIETSSFSNLTSKDFLTVLKKSGNLNYGNICLNKDECDENMFCDFSQNNNICTCNSEFNAIYSNSTGKLECMKSKLNYYDHCKNNDECFSNSICYMARCVCPKKTIFKKGECVTYNTSSSVLVCEVDEDCLKYNQLMKCSSNRYCECFAGYHRDSTFCISGSVRINSTCSSNFQCGFNAYCNSEKKCQCLNNTLSENNYDCYFSDVFTNRIPFQFIYQAYNDSYDNILYGVRNFLDKTLTRHTKSAPKSFGYSFETKISEFSPTDYQWQTTVFVDLFEHIILNELFYKEMMDLFKKQVNSFEWLSLNDYIQTSFIERIIPRYQVGHRCHTDEDCLSKLAQCTNICDRYNGMVPKVCSCQINTFQAINIADNTQTCITGKPFNSSCSMNDSMKCGVNSECSNTTGRCVCLKNFTNFESSCVPTSYLLPSNKKCLSEFDCPPFAKCSQGICYCFENYVLVNGICVESTNVISENPAPLCLAQTDCGQNSYCSYEKNLCKCLPMFEISNENNRTCKPTCSI